MKNFFNSHHLVLRNRNWALRDRDQQTVCTCGQLILFFSHVRKFDEFEVHYTAEQNFRKERY